MVGRLALFAFSASHQLLQTLYGVGNCISVSKELHERVSRVCPLPPSLSSSYEAFLLGFSASSMKRTAVNRSPSEMPKTVKSPRLLRHPFLQARMSSMVVTSPDASACWNSLTILDCFGGLEGRRRRATLTIVLVGFGAS